MLEIRIYLMDLHHNHSIERQLDVVFCDFHEELECESLPISYIHYSTI